MNPELDTRKITKLLNQSAHELDANTLTALSKAREDALRKQKKSAAWAFAGHGMPHWQLPHIQHPWLLIALLVAIMAVGVDWWQDDEEIQNCETDIAILTSDLPLEAFTN